MLKAARSALPMPRRYWTCRTKPPCCQGQAIDAAGTTITLASLGLTILDHYDVGVTVLGASAAYATVDKSTDQFTVHVWDPDGTGVSGTVKIEVGGW